jgi:ketosteroid isomerase-like protein
MFGARTFTSLGVRSMQMKDMIRAVPALLAGATLLGVATAVYAAGPPSAQQQAVAVELSDMGAAANAHDVDRHVGHYAHDASVTLIVNGERIVGWDNIRSKQQEWWNHGKTDVVYKPDMPPQFLDLGPGMVLSTLYMTAHRSTTAGQERDNHMAVSALWKKLPEGWRVIYSHESMST